jgi:hypothetical protein
MLAWNVEGWGEYLDSEKKNQGLLRKDTKFC